MKVSDHIAKSKEPIISLEILPPLKGKSIQSIYDMLDPLMEYEPSFVNVTYHRAEQMFKKTADGNYEKKEVRKRPGTVGICASILNKYQVDAVPHLICGGFTKLETENALIDLDFIGIENVLVLRGDPPKGSRSFEPTPGGNRYAIDLLRQVMELNDGSYLEEDIMDGVKTNFCVGVAGYPEKHYEAPNMQTDMKYLKDKVDSGAEYITTQMFFDNQKYFDFVDRCRAEGITVPIIPGLKPLSSSKQLQTIPSTFHIDIPTDLSDAVESAKSKKDIEQIGKEWLIAQSRELIAQGVPGLHFYTLGKPDIISEVLKEIR